MTQKKPQQRSAVPKTAPANHDASPGKQLKSVHQIRRRSSSAFDTLLCPVRWLARFKFILLMNLQDESCQGVLRGLATPEELPILSTGCCAGKPGSFHTACSQIEEYRTALSLDRLQVFHFNLLCLSVSNTSQCFSCASFRSRMRGFCKTTLLLGRLLDFIVSLSTASSAVQTKARASCSYCARASAAWRVGKQASRHTQQSDRTHDSVSTPICCGFLGCVGERYCWMFFPSSAVELVSIRRGVLLSLVSQSFFSLVVVPLPTG